MCVEILRFLGSHQVLQAELGATGDSWQTGTPGDQTMVEIEVYPPVIKHGWLENPLWMEVLWGESLISMILIHFSIAMSDTRRPTLRFHQTLWGGKYAMKIGDEFLWNPNESSGFPSLPHLMTPEGTPFACESCSSLSCSCFAKISGNLRQCSQWSPSFSNPWSIRDPPGCPPDWMTRGIFATLDARVWPGLFERRWSKWTASVSMDWLQAAIFACKHLFLAKKDIG